MAELLWQVGVEGEWVDNYRDPLSFSAEPWRVGARGQRWPLFQPSEADPAAGYEAQRRVVLFELPGEPEEHYLLSLGYLSIAPRLGYLELSVNGVDGRAYLRPEPSDSTQLHAALHTAINAEGRLELSLPGELLRAGENRLELVCRDGGEVLRVQNREAVKRLDRMANGAGLIYRNLSLWRVEQAKGVKLELRPTVFYCRRNDGDLVCACDLYLELDGPTDPATLTLELEGGGRQEALSWALPGVAFGHLHRRFELWDGEGELRYCLRGRLNGAERAWRGSFRRRRRWKVFVAPHAHVDIGYTHRAPEVAERHAYTLDRALLLFEREPALSYHLDAAWALEHYLDTRDDVRREALLARLREGRFAVAASYADLLSQFASLEDLIRNLVYTEGALRPHGLHADFAAFVDVASLSGSLPSVLAGAGVPYLLHANNQDRGPFRALGGLHRQAPFYWRGPDGAQVLLWLSKMYCELRKVCGSPPLPDAAERGLGLWLSEYEREDYAPDAVLLYGQEADNTELDPQPLEFIRRWNESYAYPQLIPSEVGSFFRYLETFKNTFRVLQGDGGAYWEDGVGSTLQATLQVRRAQALLPAAERLHALAALQQPGRRYPAERFAAAWRDELLYVEHTWGAFLSATDPEALLQDDQWAAKAQHAQDAHLAARDLLHEAATAHSLAFATAGREVVVFNPHAWPVSAPVVVEIARGEAARDAETQRPVPTRRLRETATQQLVELWLDELPGLGFRRLELREEPPAPPQVQAAPREREVLENGFYRLTVDAARGCATSWFDKGLGRELVDKEDAWGFGQFLYAEGGEGTRLVSNREDLPPGDPLIRSDFKLLRSEQTRFDFGVSLKLIGEVPHGELELEWLLFDTAKRLELRCRYRKQPRREKEAAYLAFPLALPGARARSDSQLGWVDWHEGELPGGCKEWLPLQTGVLLETEDASVHLASPDIPLFCVGDIVRGRWPKAMDLRGGRLFSYILNNYWDTNYPAQQGGEVAFRYVLTSGSALSAADAYRRGWEARLPLYAQRISYQAFREPQPPYDAPNGVLAALEGDGVVLSTLKGATWGQGFVARLQEVAGREGEATLRLPGVGRACLTDLLERDLEELPVEKDGSVRVSLPAWGLASVRLVPRGAA